MVRESQVALGLWLSLAWCGWCGRDVPACFSQLWCGEGKAVRARGRCQAVEAHSLLVTGKGDGCCLAWQRGLRPSLSAGGWLVATGLGPAPDLTLWPVAGTTWGTGS